MIARYAIAAGVCAAVCLHGLMETAAGRRAYWCQVRPVVRQYTEVLEWSEFGGWR